MAAGSPATSEMVGRTCPYCRFALDEGISVVGCPVCDAVHHTDCWEENSGCAVALCAGGPSMADEEPQAMTTTVMPQPPVPPQTVAPPPPPASPPPVYSPPPPVTAAPAPFTGRPMAQKPGVPPLPPPGARVPGAGPPGAPPPPWPSSRKPWTAFAPIVVAGIILLGGATAAALVLTGNSHKTGPVEAEYQSYSTAEGEPEESAEENGVTESPEEEGSSYTPPPTQSPTEEAEEEVKETLHDHFERLVDGEYASAYEDLTSALASNIGSEAGWEEAQRADGLESFHLALSVSIQGSHSAQAEIMSFITHAAETGCHRWTGSWEMVKQYGTWLISAAHLERGSC
jgi:hypothetical protein